MHRPTVEVYERHAAEWQSQRTPRRTDGAAALHERVTSHQRVTLHQRAAAAGPVVDLGCGPGWYAPALGPPDGRSVVALDAARAMLDLVPGHAPAAWRVQADLAALPFRRAALGGAWASKCYVHLARHEVPMALGDLHAGLDVGAPLELHVFEGDLEHGPLFDDDFAGRLFSRWPPQLLADVVTGAGFVIDATAREEARDGVHLIKVQATRARTLADTVGPDMRLLVCGLNPRVDSADAGMGFARNGNRFWPAAVAAGVVSRARDPRHALAAHGVGMTDLVKRATPRADGLTAAEYRSGVARIERLATWLAPAAICFVGLAGWRAAVDRHATAGPQPEGLGGSPVYVMPSTSGVNARVSPDELRDHLRSAMSLGDR